MQSGDVEHKERYRGHDIHVIGLAALSEARRTIDRAWAMEIPHAPDKAARAAVLEREREFSGEVDKPARKRSWREKQTLLEGW
jgi:hypothetical protein